MFKKGSIKAQCSEIADPFINLLMKRFDRSYPQLKPCFSLDVKPASRLHPVSPKRRRLRCGGFANNYRVTCDLLGVHMRPDIAWDVKSLPSLHRDVAFRINAFEQPISKDDFSALMLALQYNTFYEALVLDDVKPEPLQPLLDLLKRSKRISKLSFKNCGLTKDTAVQVLQAIAANPSHNFKYIDLFKNEIGSRSISPLCSYIGKVSQLTHFDISGCTNAKGLTQIFQAFKKQPAVANSLRHLRLNNIKMDATCSQELAAWLAQPNKLKRFSISDTGHVRVDLVVEGMTRGSRDLERLDISSNKLSSAKDIPALVRFFSSAAALSDINVSDCNINGRRYRLCLFLTMLVFVYVVAARCNLYLQLWSNCQGNQHELLFDRGVS